MERKQPKTFKCVQVVYEGLPSLFSLAKVEALLETLQVLLPFAGF